MKRLLTITVAALMLAGCAAPASPQLPSGAGAKALNTVTLPKAPAEDDYEALSALREAVGEDGPEAALDFAVRSSQAVLAQNGAGQNRLYSPLSLYFALAMAAETAGGATKAQILSALGIDEAALTKTGDLYRLLYTDNAYTRLLLANSAWVQEAQGAGTDAAVEFRKEALDKLAQSHYAAIFSANFKDKASGEAIGAWISKQTNGLLGGGFEADPQTLMLLVNTVYFKSEWTDRFLVEKTASRAFHNGDGTESQADFMHKTGMQPFIRTEQYTAATLGLKGGSVRFLLPNEGVSPQDIIGGGGWTEAIKGGESTGYGDVTWKVPKLDYDESVSLNEAAKALGIQDAFDPVKADFTPLCDSPLYISGIHQQSAVSMDENGIEAASYTDIAYAGAAMPTDKAEMILDRPFIYIIYTSEGLPLFVGVVNEM